MGASDPVTGADTSLRWLPRTSKHTGSTVPLQSRALYTVYTDWPLATQRGRSETGDFEPVSAVGTEAIVTSKQEPVSTQRLF